MSARFRHYLDVAVPVPMATTFTYGCNADRVVPGQRVLASFGPRQLVGIVTAVRNSPPDGITVKAIRELLPIGTGLPDTLLKLLQWASQYYHHPLGEVLRHALPQLLREARRRPECRLWQLTESGRQLDPASLKRAPRQQQLLRLLRQQDCDDEQLRQAGIDLAVARRLQALGYLCCQWQHPPAADTPRHQWRCRPDSGHQLGTDQAAAVAAITQSQGFAPFLLEGVTGSGKTEVYLQAMAPLLATGLQALVIVPEISLTPQTLERFSQRFDAPVAMLHSAMTQLQRLTVWQQARQGQIAVVIGTRSAIFTPFARLGIIIVDEEHDSSLKQQEGFRYHGRDLAIKRAQLEQIPLVLGSATPSLESLHNALSGRYTHLQLSQRPGAVAKVRSGIIDCRQQVMEQGISKALLDAIKTTLARGEQAMIFLNRRGYAPSLVCHECQWQACCLRCHKPYTYHQQSRRLLCHHCGSDKPLPARCGQCGSPAILPLGLGTERLADHLQHKFPDARLVRVDRDSTRHKGQLEQLLDQIRQGQADIIIGTQMLAKGHHFANVTLVAIIDVDAALYSFDFRAPEKLAQLLVQVSGRSGRADKAGQVLLQTCHPQHPLFQQVLHQGYHHYGRQALSERKLMALPPFSYQAVLRASAPRAELPQQFLQALATCDSGQAVEILGPVPAVMEKKAGHYRFVLLLQASQRATLHRHLHVLLDHARHHPLTNKVRWHLDVDPIEVC